MQIYKNISYATEIYKLMLATIEKNKNLVKQINKLKVLLGNN